MKKRILSMVMVSLMAVSLSACGGGSNEIKNAKEPVTAAQAFHTESIWFQSSDAPSKDGEIESILYFDGKGNVTRYKTDITYGDLKGLSEEKILNLAQEQDQAQFEAKVASVLEGAKNSKSSAEDELAALQEEIDLIKSEMEAVETAGVTSEQIEEDVRNVTQFQQEQVSELQETVERCNKVIEALDSGFDGYEKPEAMSFTLSVETDGTGNNTSSETLTVTYAEMDFYGDSEDFLTYVNEEEEIEFESDYGFGVLPVYDMNFSGFPGLYTVVNEKHAGFIFDTPGTDGIIVE